MSDDENLGPPGKEEGPGSLRTGPNPETTHTTGHRQESQRDKDNPGGGPGGNGAAALAVPVIDPDADALTAALAYAAAGWYVLPVRRGTKKPGTVVGDQWQRQSSRDPDQIVAWFAGTDHGIALHCGRSGAVVFDVDDPSKVPDVLARHLGAAPYQSSRPDDPDRGHYPFAVPPGRTLGNGTGGLGGEWGEIRGLNGVIIAAPSHHRDGGEYRWVRAGLVPVLPDEIAQLLPDGNAAEDAATDEAVAAFIAEHTEATRPEIMEGWIKALCNKFETSSRHTGAVSVTTGALKESRCGYLAAQAIIDTLRPMFIAAATRPPTGGVHQRTEREAANEYQGIVAWAVAQANAADLAEVRARTEEKMPTGVEEVTLVDRSNADQTAVLNKAHKMFQHWLGAEYDLDAVDLVLVAAMVERLDGDPLWVLLVSGSGNAKTETVQSLQNRPHAHVVSTISSTGALLSATSKRDTASDATGGLLRLIGDHGVLVIKDFTSILSMSRELRAEVLAALREIYDGKWVRTVGTDGGKTLTWVGRIVVVGAVTTAWDTAHTAVASMGDRFVLLRPDSTTGRQAAGRRAIAATGSETRMREQLAGAVAEVLSGAATEPVDLHDDEREVLLAAADLVTLARTGVEFDYRGDVIDAHAPEMPTRFAKQLAQVVRGGVAVGMCRADAMRLAIRCARDSMPPLRLAIIDHLAAHPGSCTTDVRKGIDKPRATVDRQLQALHMLGVLACSEASNQFGGTSWCYSLNHHIEGNTLVVPEKASPEMSVCAYAINKTVGEDNSVHAPSDKSGDARPATTSAPVNRNAASQ